MAGVALGDINPSLCVAGVALGHIHLHFAWQAWHLTTSIVTLRGKGGTYGTGLALVVRVVTRWRGGAAVPHIFVWGSCFWFCIPPSASSRLLPSSLVLITHNLSSHTTCSHTSCHHTTCSLTHNLSSHNLLTHTHLVLTQLTTCSHTTCPHTHLVITPSLCVAGVALGDIHLHFAWQAWHLVTSTLHFARQAGHLVTSTFTLRGRRGT